MATMPAAGSIALFALKQVPLCLVTAPNQENA